MGEVELPIREPVGINRSSRYLSQTGAAKLTSREKIRLFLEDPGHSRCVNIYL
jgi:hypothetical protein